MKKTALQQLIEQLELYKRNSNSYSIIWQTLIDESTELLETEREQIEDAFSYGKSEGDTGKSRSSEEYYKDTYQ